MILEPEEGRIEAKEERSSPSAVRESELSTPAL